jgi:hypothetical protein
MLVNVDPPVLKRAMRYVPASFFRLYQDSAISLTVTSEGAMKSPFEISPIDCLLKIARVFNPVERFP